VGASTHSRGYREGQYDMNVTEIVGTSIFIGIAFAGAVAVVIGLGLTMHVENANRGLILPLLMPVMGSGMAASVLFSDRDLKFASIDIGFIGGGTNPWILRAFTVTILLLGAARVVGALVRRDDGTYNTPGLSMFLWLSAYFVGSNMLPMALGTEPRFVHNLFYPFVLFAAFYVGRREALAPLVESGKWILTILMIGSLALAALKPALALQSNYLGWLPGVNVRLWGLGSNANSIGPLALISLLLIYWQPWQRSWINWLAASVAFAVFVLAQSKTVWLAAGLMALILMRYRAIESGRRVSSPAMIGLFLIGVLSTTALFLYADAGAFITKALSSKAGTQITTFTGRFQIWQVAFEEWRTNPLFGYGPSLWDADFRARIGMSFAFTAHNQFVHTLAEAGTVGFAGLMAYLAVVTPAVFRMASVTRGASVALYVFILVRCMTETPLLLDGILSAELMTHLLLFATALRGTLHNSVGSNARIGQVGTITAAT
jgi:O-antigen ligase